MTTLHVSVLAMFVTFIELKISILKKEPKIRFFFLQYLVKITANEATLT